MQTIKSIAIIGGGTAGWLTAAALAHRTKLDITLVESQELGTIGVGESLVDEVIKFLESLDLDLDDMIPAVDATHKLSLLFKDFYLPGEEFNYSFGPYATELKLHHAYAHLAKKGQLKSVDWSLIFQRYTAASYANKAYPEGKMLSLQLDATKLARYLKEKRCSRVEHIVATVSNVKTENEHVTGVETECGKTIEADYYIDCTGFNALLMNAINTKYISFDELVTDRAVVARIPYKNEEHKKENMISYTECTAMKYGWRWRIPLWSRMGNGYVYSSKFVSDEDAEKEFREALDWDGDVNIVKFKTGMREEQMKNNVLAIGLSSSFVEPLESTGLSLITERIDEFVNILLQRRCSIDNFDTQYYNKYVKRNVSNIRAWIYVHYRLTARTDTDFWKFYQSGESDKYIDEDVMNKLIGEYSQVLIRGPYSPSPTLATTYAGMYRPMTSSYDNDVTEEDCIRLYERIERNKRMAKDWQNHYEHLKQKYYK